MVTTVLAVLAFVVGALLVATTVLSAIMTLVVPRALPVMITRWVFRGMRALFKLRGGRARSFEARDRDMALYGPISLFSLAATWLVLTGTGYMLLFWSLGARPLVKALELSGSSIYTLGFVVPVNLPTMVLAFSEAGFGLVLLAMLISYLPSMYQSFQRREAAVTALDVRANTPPTASFEPNCYGEGCAFINKSTDPAPGAIVSYAWNYGDGGTSSRNTACFPWTERCGLGRHVYSITGPTTFTVTLTVTDNLGAVAVASKTITVNVKEPQRALTSIAEEFGTYFLELKLLNPEFKKDFLPHGTYQIKVPRQTCPSRCFKQEKSP